MSEFTPAYLKRIGIVELGVRQHLLTLHSDLHQRYIQGQQQATLGKTAKWLRSRLNVSFTLPQWIQKCEQKLVVEQGITSKFLFAALSPDTFTASFLTSLGITPLGIQQVLLAYHRELHQALVVNTIRDGTKPVVSPTNSPAPLNLTDPNISTTATATTASTTAAAAAVAFVDQVGQANQAGGKGRAVPDDGYTFPRAAGGGSHQSLSQHQKKRQRAAESSSDIHPSGTAEQDEEEVVLVVDSANADAQVGDTASEAGYCSTATVPSFVAAEDIGGGSPVSKMRRLE